MTIMKENEQLKVELDKQKTSEVNLKKKVVEVEELLRTNPGNFEVEAKKGFAHLLSSNQVDLALKKR